MKTLNEVIFEAPYSPTPWEADALYYLKTIETTENLYHDAVNELSKWKEEDWKDRCLPLTWEELNNMQGKPIWVEYEGYTPGWEIIEHIGVYKWTINTDDNEIIIETNSSILHEEEQGKTWQAYKKEKI